MCLVRKKNNMAAPLRTATASIGNILTDTKKDLRKKPRKATPRKHKSHFRKGLEVWVHDSSEVWLPATVTSVDPNGCLAVKLQNGQESVLVLKGDYPPVSGGVHNCENADDLTDLKPLCEAAVLHCLRARFLSGVYSTSAGITLIAINPFQEVGGFYGNDAILEYRCGRSKKKPHVFAMAERAYSQMVQGIGQANQSIIVSGESGAGKTWTARCLMKYLATVAVYNPGGFEPSPGDCIEKRILDSNPILEAFGNAGTARNNNSSRFGKYIQLQFDRGHHIIGASIQTYLLEKTRVVCQSPGERNFHIFYQLYHGIKEHEKTALGLGNAGHRFRYLPLENCGDEALEDASSFATTIQAMSNVGLSQAYQIDIFKVLAGLLHLGNISFTADDDVESCDIDEHNSDYQLSADFAAELLGLDRDQLEKSLMFRKITASHSRRKSIFLRPCSVEEAGTRRDCMAKLLYARLFDWLGSFINKSTCAGRWHSFIGLLDIYGFESFQSNSLEQLCINYANEKLQQHFVEHFLRAEQEEYSSEGIEWNFCSFTDNQPCLDVIEGKNSIFALMNEECCLNRQTDAQALGTRLLDGVIGKHIDKPPVSVRHPAFIVKHYADDVIYSTNNLIEKNRDHIPTELIELVGASRNAFVAKLILTDLAELKTQSCKNGKAQAKTVVSKFKASLDSLMATLTYTAPHYIRCIKPNLACKPDVFDSRHVVSQLRACGVLETIEISAKGFPARMTYAEFQERYRPLNTSVTANSPYTVTRKDGNSGKDICIHVMEHLFGEEDKENMKTRAQFGKKKIFLQNGQLEILEHQKAFAMSQAAVCIQRTWRKHLKRFIVRRQQAATLLQAAYRGWKVRQCLEIMNDAARVIQHAMLEYSIRRKQTRQRLEQEATLESTLLDGSPVKDRCLGSVSISENSQFLGCRDEITGVAHSSFVLSEDSRTNSQILGTQSNTAFHLHTPKLPAVFSASLLPRRYATADFATRTNISSDDIDDIDGEISLSESFEKDTKVRLGLGQTVAGFFKKPAVDLALAAVVTGLLLKGPLRL